MPILDPKLQIYLFGNWNIDPCANKDFFIRYLQIAASNYNNNFDTIQTSLTFKKDLMSSSLIIGKVFGGNYMFERDLNNPEIKNYYSYLLDKIRPYLTDKITSNQKGYYFHYKDIYLMRLFQPKTNFPKHRAWFLTDSPIAILAVDLLAFKESDDQIISYLNLEIDLMAASGFSLVLCIRGHYAGSEMFAKLLSQMVSTHQFAEIHINFSVFLRFGYITGDLFAKETIDFEMRELLDTIEELLSNNGYVYFYTTFPIKDKEKEYDKVHFSKYKSKKPFFNLFFLSDYLMNSFHNDSMGNNFIFANSSLDDPYFYKPFVYCKIGFDQDLMRIILCNVPLYDSSDEETDLIPSSISGIALAYMSKNDFLCCESFRVRILFDDVTGDRELVEKYVDFDGIHLIRPDFYVKDSLNLAKTDFKTLKKVNKIKEKSDKKYIKNQGEEFKKENIFHLFKSKQIQKGLQYVIYAYQHFVNSSLNSSINFQIHTNQIFAAFEACKVCLLNNNGKEKGVVYQIETGEGKSCIIQLIAAVLALSKKTVHITSSNINLANRDYYESYNFFQQLNLESAVLLHYNELPYINFQNLPNDNTIYLKENYPRKYFSKKLFKNSSRMNYSVCGITNNNELSKNKANIVFSTFVNFESLYLRIMEMYPSYIHSYFNDCSLLIDEADSILIDELTNGTILSRPMNTNGKEILTFVYKCHKDEIDVNHVLDEIKCLWPECTDISVNDIIEMYKEIEIVNQPEFTNGKKYSIETIYVKEKSKSIKQKVEDLIQNIRIKSFEQIHKIYDAKNNRKHSDELINEKINGKTENEVEEDCIFSYEDIEDSDYSDFLDSSDYSEDSEQLNSINDNNITSDVKEENKDKKKEKKKMSKSKFNESNKEKIFKTKSREKNDDKMKDYKKYKMIIPFDYEHKGILEPNKEFSGFIQQFIAIKEMFNDEENSNMIIKDVSMDYLYVSHPIFVKLYGGVCGLTGTIGNKYDKEILQKHYNLSTMKIPRNAPNRRVDLPIIICSSIRERNEKITEEVYKYNLQDIPVLVIFQDLNEILEVYHLLSSKGIKNINIFDGKDEKIKPDKIAGLKGAVSLGTNVCGRGTDIKEPYKPLHVIIAYFSSNSRVLHQAYGRTARQGNDGTVRVICLNDQFMSPYQVLKDNSMEDTLSYFDLKNNLQIKYIEEFRKKRKWIFDGDIKSQKISREYIKKMRDVQINVNRIKAFNYKFPICMKIQTFIIIQAQKIFSLYNCPNCKYTWMLFQKYLRELILETWSLFIFRTDQEYFLKPQKLSYNEFLNDKFNDLMNFLRKLIPQADQQNQNVYEIVPTFMNIFEFVTNLFEMKIMNSFPKQISNCYVTTDNDRFCSFLIGFIPYSLVDKSGARINALNKEDQEQEYICDPELKYIMKQPKGFKPILVSITEKIDDIFNKICKKINDVVGCYMGIKFFLRRTLGGCEFGLCFDLQLENENENLINDYNCLIDKDPLLVFKISVKSMVPLLAGILIIGLVYIAKLAASIIQLISGMNIELAGKIIKQTVKIIIEQLCTQFLRDQIENFCSKLCDFLTTIVVNQINNIQKFNEDFAFILRLLLKIAAGNDFTKSTEMINKIFEKCSWIKMTLKFSQEIIPMKYMFRIGFLIMLAFASFMMNFQYKRKALKYKTEKVASSYDKSQKTDEAFIANEKYVDERFD